MTPPYEGLRDPAERSDINLGIRVAESFWWCDYDPIADTVAVVLTNGIQMTLGKTSAERLLQELADALRRADGGRGDDVPF